MKLTVKQVAEREQVSEAAVRSWLRHGLAHYRLGAKGVGGKILIDEGDLKAWVEACRVVENPTPRPAPKTKSEYQPKRFKL